VDEQDKTRQDKTRQERLSPEEVRDLVRRAQAGDEKAEHRLHRLCRPLANQVRRKLTLSADLAEDWDGVVYLILHRLIQQYEGAGAVEFYPYILRTLQPAVWSWVRQQQISRHREPLAADLARYMSDEMANLEETGHGGHGQEGILWMGAGDEVSIEHNAISRLLWEEALNGISARRRQIVLRYLEGYTCAEIARELGISVDACQKELQRSRKALQSRLEKAGSRDVQSL
jgi:RNA polymerase sigma factor (sigma-70 family)